MKTLLMLVFLSGCGEGLTSTSDGGEDDGGPVSEQFIAPLVCGGMGAACCSTGAMCPKSVKHICRNGACQ